MGQAGRAPRRAEQPGGADEAVEGGAAGVAARYQARRLTAFAFVQLEFGFALGPDDGRYLRRARGTGTPERVIVLRTLGARERRHLRGRRPKPAGSAEQPEPVPTARATVVRTEPFGSSEEGEVWLERMRRDTDALQAEVDDALRELNAMLRAHRAAAADPYVREVSMTNANVVRVGIGNGDEVAAGHFSDAYELPPAPRALRPSVALRPQERLAAVLNGSGELLVAEELVLRARADLAAGREREAALQARIALEALVAEAPGEATAEVERHRAEVAEAAGAALRGELGPERVEALRDAVDAMRRALLKTIR